MDYVDPDKNPQVGAAAGRRNLVPQSCRSGAKKEEAKSMTEEGITGSLDPGPEEHDAHGLLVRRAAESIKWTTATAKGFRASRIC